MSRAEPSPEPEKPKPKVSAKTVFTLRHEVRAKDKFAAVGKPEEEAVRLIADEYKTTDDSAREFVQWLKGPASGAPPEKPSTGKPLESWHRKGDIVRATEDLLSDDASAAARAKGAGKGKKKS